MSTPNNRSGSNNPTTPVNNNYAAPHTPIASAKRPRSHGNHMLSPGTASKQVPEDSEVKDASIPSSMLLSPKPSRSNEEEDPLSPLHPVRSVKPPHKSDPHEEDEEQLFSPTLHLDKSTNTEDEPLYQEEEEVEEEPLPEASSSHGEEDDASDASEYSEDSEEFNPYLFIKSLPPYEVVKSLRPPIALPPKKDDAPPITLVLDLDETLVHCTVEPVDNADLTFPVKFHGMTYQVHVRLRPYLFEFLDAIQDKYEVVVFTASQEVYASELLNRIDPEGKYIHHRMYRESCLAVEGNFLKDLTVLGRDLSSAVLVDNSPHAFGYQVDNGIPIESWFDDPRDTELLKLERFLRTLQKAKDVRSVVRKKFQTYQLIEDA